MINISTFKGKVSPKLHGASLVKVVGVYDKLYEASGMLLNVVRPYSTIRKFRIENAIYDKIYNYACNDDIFADGIIDIRPIGQRSTQDSLQGSFDQQFDIKKKENSFAIEEINGIKTLRLSKCLTPRILLADMNSLTIGQTVTGSGDVTDLDVDYLDYISGNAAIKFGLSGSTGQGKITIALDSAVDLSTLEGIGAVFPWFKFPLSTALTNVKIRVGNSVSAYVESTVTAAHDRAFESDAWMLLMQNLATATETGTVDFSAIDWIQIEINYTSGTARTNVKIDSITAALGQAWEVIYYSKYLFTDSTGVTWKEIPTAETDLIRLDDPGDIVGYLYTFMLTLQQELKGKNMAADFAYFSNQLNGLHARNGTLIQEGIYDLMKNKYPNQAIIRQVDYYEFGDLDGAGDDGSQDDW